ncbi:arabinosyltransferase domain-containing protein [Corynebacterium sp. CCUG 69979]|uniref:arabinosyltransferase domain-containing protein n=1 Tax=Corynebacterium sp. CCUG 69979 TaxID=2823890 RepID=UPI00210865EB|nr:arabinosyltransferase domain-containing protein [Corynebacterium sp. CCUG 69979]MCQ4624468.1 arabinosyltransferase domain-containing protein [Corynebacterium sp. CCUG 69979]
MKGRRVNNVETQTVVEPTGGSTAFTPESDPLAHSKRAPRNLALTAMMSGLLAFIFFALLPFLPVKQVQSSFDWPQNGSLNSVNAPLISLAPESLELTIPISVLEELAPGQSNVLSTLPVDSTEALDRGLFVTAPSDGSVNVSSLNEVVFELTAEELATLDGDAVLEVSATDEALTVSVPGTDLSEETEDDMRPQVTGIYSELTGDAQALIDTGLTAHVEINSRFTSSPSLVKWFAMIAGTIAALIALWSIARMDLLDGRRLSVLRPEWRSFKPLDGVVVTLLLFWHFFGANTSDDGFLLTMARVANESDYMANYYRWYGVPEAPFGSPFYDLLSLLSKVSTASAWMRLPTLIAGILIWWILSREILPRLGATIATRRVSYWTAAFMFLAFWLPYDNGLRPEPIIALGTLATWASFESAIASRRLLPAALGTIFAAVTLACGPTGLTAVGVFLVCLPQVLKILSERRVIAPLVSYVFPFLGAGFAVMVLVFKDQTLATVLESTSVRSAVGPALEWYNEYVRYATLLEATVDGSLTRRFPMLILVLCLVLVLWSMSHYGAVPGAKPAPTRRMLAIFGLSMFFLMFTPTKWTHHFGIYAGIAGAAAALGAIVLAQVAARSPRARTFALAAVMFVFALALGGWNAWWYVSSFAVPWWDKTVQYKGVEASSVMLALFLLTLVVGIVQSLWHKPRPGAGEGPVAGAGGTSSTRISRAMTAPIALACILIVAFSCLTFLKSFMDQSPAYSVGMGNVRSLKGETCQMSADVLLEANTNDSFLTPVDGVPLGKSLESGTVRGFHPEGVPAYINSDNEGAANVGAIQNTPATDSGAGSPATGATGATSGSDQNASTAVTDTGSDTQSDDAGSDTVQSTSRATTQGNRPSDQIGVNGSTVRLPFNLDYNRIPVLGTFSENALSASEIKTSWFELPDATEEAPLLVTSVAGRLEHRNISGEEKEGQTLKLEYGTRDEEGNVTEIGDVEMLDPGPTTKWRNLRYPIADLPEGANVVRLVGEDVNLDPEEWMALTPLRNPTLEPLTEVFGPDVPGLLDWPVAMQFPCNRTFNHYAGVTEIPEFRIAADAKAKEQLSGFQDFLGGGAMATAEAVNSAYEMPGYLNQDWHRDWGSAYRYVPRTNSRGETPDVAEINHETITRSGLWHPSDMKIRDPYENED